MPVSNMPLVERIARVIAGRVVSINSGGEDAHAGARVDQMWRDFEGDAIAIIKTLREPDAAMAEAGDVEVWRRMIETVLVNEGEVAS